MSSWQHFILLVDCTLIKYTSWRLVVPRKDLVCFCGGRHARPFSQIWSDGFPIWHQVNDAAEELATVSPYVSFLTPTELDSAQAHNPPFGLCNLKKQSYINRWAPKILEDECGNLWQVLDWKSIEQKTPLCGQYNFHKFTRTTSCIIMYI